MLTALILLAGCSGPKPRTSLALPQPTGGTCRPGALEPTPFPRQDLKSVPWLKAEPAASGITAHLFYSYNGNAALHTGGTWPDGKAAKILWLIDNPGAGTSLEIAAVNITGAGTFRDVVPAVMGSPEYPSILNLPSSGCCMLRLKSGTVEGTLSLMVSDNA